jgi:hypothetical protein
MIFEGLLKDEIPHKLFLSEYDRLRAMIDVVATSLKASVEINKTEKWETSTPIPLLTETYSKLLNLKKYLTSALMGSGTVETVSFTKPEKAAIKFILTDLETDLKVLRTIFGICVDVRNLS